MNSLAAPGAVAFDGPHTRRAVSGMPAASGALAALTVALSAWVQSDGAEELPALVDRAFRALRHGPKNRPRNHCP